MTKTNYALRLDNAIQKIFEENNQVFFDYAWRENVEEFLSRESKYNQLVQWINERIEMEFGFINVFNPADKDEKYSKRTMKEYLSACQNAAVLMNAREIILDKKCTTKMRENWEYTLCKLFNLRYSKSLGYIHIETKEVPENEKN